MLLLWGCGPIHSHTSGRSQDEPLEASSRHEDPASDVPGRNVLTPDVGVVRRTVLQAVWGPIVFGGAFVAAFRIISALVVRGYPKPPPLPDDSVVNAVGTLDTFYSAPAGSLSKCLRVRVFYPVEAGRPVGGDAPYMPYGRDTTDGMAGLVSFPPFLLAYLADADSGCQTTAPCAPPPTGRPLQTHGGFRRAVAAPLGDVRCRVAAVGEAKGADKYTGSRQRMQKRCKAPPPPSPPLLQPASGGLLFSSMPVMHGVFIRH